MMDRVPMLPLICAVLLVTLSGAGQNASPVNDRANPYALVGNWPQLPKGRTLGAVSGVDIDADGSSVWLADRCGGDPCADSTVAPILKFDAQGRLVKAFGAGLFAIPHGVHVDREGNIWVTDDSPTPTPGKGHQVIKFDPDGKVLLTLGKPGVLGTGPDTFNRPSDVVVAPNGDIFVADGQGRLGRASPSPSRAVYRTRPGPYPSCPRSRESDRYLKTLRFARSSRRHDRRPRRYRRSARRQRRMGD